MSRVREVQAQALNDHVQSVSLLTEAGEIPCRYWPAQGGVLGCVWVPGAIGGWHSPAFGLYTRLADEFQIQGIHSLQVHYRAPGELQSCISEVLAGIEFLEAQGAAAIGLIGHSFGGAVVIRAAAEKLSVVTVVALATQSHGAAGAVPKLGPRCSLLLAHGTEDEVLPPACSSQVYQAARELKKFILEQGARHGLDENADALTEAVRKWLDTELNRRADPAGS